MGISVKKSAPKEEEIPLKKMVLKKPSPNEAPVQHTAQPPEEASTIPNAHDAGVSGTVVIQHADGSLEETKEAYPSPAVMSAHPVMVGVSIGMTRNLGNYESIKATVSLTVPSAPDSDEIEETYNQAKNWVDSKINAFTEEINENLS